MIPETEISEIDLGVNNIFLLNTLKKVRAYYYEELYKLNSQTTEQIVEDESEEVEVVKEEKVIQIFITDKKILSLVKISPQQFSLIRPTLTLFFIESNWKQAINIDSIRYYFDNTDINKIEREYLEWNIEFEKSQTVVSLENMTFNDKVQKIYSTIETLTNQKVMLKQMETETLESDAGYVELQTQKEEILEALKQRKNEILSNTSLQTKTDEINKELSEEKKVLVEFLEFSVENWDYKEVSVRNKDWKELRPQISISLKEVKNK